MSKEAISGWSVGIDLGTTYSCVGVWQHKQVEIISNDQGYRTTPSYVAFTDTERLIGEAAKSQVAMNPENTVFDAKRLIGREFNDPCVSKDSKHWSFKPHTIDALTLDLDSAPDVASLSNWREPTGKDGEFAPLSGVKVSTDGAKVTLEGIDLDDDVPIRFLVADVK